MPVNDTGYVLTVGPDPDGRFVEIQPGEHYGPPLEDAPLEESAPADEPSEPVKPSKSSKAKEATQ